MTNNKIKTVLKEKVRTNKFLLLSKNMNSVATDLVGVAKIGRKHFRFEVALRNGTGVKRIRFISVKLV